MSAELAQSVRGRQVCAVNNACDLAPWADIVVANDIKWWKEHAYAKDLPGRKFSSNIIDGVERAMPTTYSFDSNSGVLALDVLRNIGATRIVMLGFDMRGTHFFGNYTNKCGNTTVARRRIHMLQFKAWRHRNKTIDVVNATTGSSLAVFPSVELAACLA